MMTSTAKRALAKTIRGLRERLLRDLHDHTESVYRLSVRTRDARLDEARRVWRERLEAWIAEQVRTDGKGDGAKRTSDDFRRDAEKQAAYTWLNRLVVLRLMEVPGENGRVLRGPAVVGGGWESQGYKQFRQLAPALVRGDETEGYAFLLGLVFEDLATELPGLFGAAGVADLIPMPAATLRFVVEELNQESLDSCWTDDMTLGWVYQYWNDPERERLDDKINPKKTWGSGKIEPHEIASKTQMFTERYMVDWLLQNSLGPMWLAMCMKHGWTPEAQADGTLAGLEARRVEWRTKRDAGEVELTALMPLNTDAERRWAYYVPQEIPDDAVAQAPATVRDLKILDPAVGSGHFLVVALDLLVALYREEARHRGEAWKDNAIVERILSYNLHGIDLDPRAVQIAAATLWLKAQQIAPGARPERLNLVASNLKLASLSDDDPALVELRREVQRETGIPGALTDSVVHALRGADHLGSLLKVDRAVDEALSQHEAELGRALAQQGHLFEGFAEKQQRLPLDRGEARASLLDRLERFLSKHTSGDDLGLRLRGEQLAAGVRFVRMAREETYDLVVANPPYQGTSKMADAKYLEKAYPLGKADLYAAFLLRGLELVRKGGVSAMLMMRNWMFIKTFAGLRDVLLSEHGLQGLGDFDRGAFEDVPDEVVAVAVAILVRDDPRRQSVTLGPTSRDDRSRDNERTARKRAATLCHVGRHTFDPAALKVVPEWPLVYWWDDSMLRAYQSAPLIGKVSPGRAAQSTGDNPRFVRLVWEIGTRSGHARSYPIAWLPFVNGGKGRQWFEELREVANWAARGVPVKVSKCHKTGVETCSLASEEFFLGTRGVAFSMIGANFSARVHRYPSIFGNMGSSVFPTDLAGAVCAMNSGRSRDILSSLNPGVHFEVGDVNRLPLFPIVGADTIFAQVESAFALHESHREPSVEFKRPGPSPWHHVQDWAQLAVDRPEGAPLPEYTEALDPEPPTDHLSFALGVALGRFAANGDGFLDPTTADLTHALPAGILFLDTTLDAEDKRDGLGHAATVPLYEAWKTHGPAIDTKRTLRDWLALDFFKDVHKGMYDTRPIHWPLSSQKKTFVAWVNIHRFDDRTLRVLLADHLHPALARIEGELTDLRAARDGADKKAARDAEKRYDKVLKARDELQTFVADVEQCADRGPLPTDSKCPPREQDARYAPDLDDGVMINSAALWKLLEPQWKDPKKWYKELATVGGKKGYDWSHLAMRYWPTRVDERCQQDPSLGVAHGCFWRYHSGRAWAWELRLQDEISPDFRITEAPYRPGDRDRSDHGDAPHRAAWIRDHAPEALAAIEKEAIRRTGRGKDRTLVSELRILERGLWSALPDEVWAMELRLAEKQGADFHLRAPDEADARTTFESAHPDRVKARAVLIKNLVPARVLFEEDETDGEDSDIASDDPNGETGDEEPA